MISPKIGQSRISSALQKAEEQIERFQNPQTETNLQRSRNYAIEAGIFVVQAREELEVVRRPEIDQTRLDSVLRELEDQIERVRNPQTKTKLQRKLNYAAQEARGGTDATCSQLQMVQEELAILVMNRVAH